MTWLELESLSVIFNHFLRLCFDLYVIFLLIDVMKNFHCLNIWLPCNFCNFHIALQLALAYNEALMSGKLSCEKGGIIQSTFLESLRKHVEEILASSLKLKDDLCNYLNLSKWPNGEKVDSLLLAWYLQWYGVPPPDVVKSACEKIKGKAMMSSSVVPLLRLLLPTAHIKALNEIDKFQFSLRCWKHWVSTGVGKETLWLLTFRFVMNAMVSWSSSRIRDRALPMANFARRKMQVWLQKVLWSGYFLCTLWWYFDCTYTSLENDHCMYIQNSTNAI